ncbi:non-ribosomal peptide synthetase [Streptomyces sp. CB01635]|uniref:non-ribosomal peptide synthetase n=1 Tax=unclassified Streptomyces TaxID=2593676 RepID=UPI000C278F03|nr:non-ribosomal peptide synthetase [Streptomyces sp. CB01635]PJN08545.1 non-ribosomal peptide synthetase [Streptomyces sp. CB01635]
MTETLPADTSALQRAVAELSPERRALLARHLARGRAGSGISVTALPRTGEAQRYVASPGQQQLYYQYQLDPSAVNYLLPIAVRLRGDLDTQALERALAAVVARHEALRTRFATDPEHGVVQVVGTPDEVRVALGRGRARADEVPALLDRIARRPFDLSAAPLLRANLWQLTDDPEAPDGRTWLLTLCVHHIVVDGWSLGVLVDELTEGYAAQLAGRPANLPELAVQYPDFAAAHHTWLAGDEAARQIAHWREQLDGVLPLELAGDRPRPARPTFSGAAVRIDLDAQLVERADRLGRTEKATPFMVLLAAYAVVLHRWSAARDLVIGTAVAGRTRPESEPLIGFFVNTLPLRVTVDDAASFRELLRATRDSSLDGFARQDVPFPRIVREVGGERTSGRSALVRALFALRNVPLRHLELAGVRAETLNLPKTGSDIDLSLEFSPAEHGGGLTGWLSYSFDLFDQDTAERIARAVHQVLTAAIASDGDTAVRDLPVLTEEEHTTLALHWSGRDASAPGGDGLLDAFHAHALATPDATAVVADVPPPATGHRLTYRELDERAGRLAHLLRARGIGPEDRVALLLPRGLDLLVCLLAVLKAGAVLVPLESEHPAGRLAGIVADATPCLTLTDTRLAARLPEGTPVLTVEDLPTLTAHHPATGPDVPELPGSGAYVLYTSGSTGAPKGVLITRAGLANRLAGMCADLGLGADERVLHKTPLSADTSMWELLVALRSGGRVVLAAPGLGTDVDYLYSVLARHSVTTCFFVPSALRPAIGLGGLPRAAAALRLVISAGEELPADLADQLLLQVPHIRLVNSYGPTETTINIAEHTVTAPAASPVPIGRPVPGGDLYVLDGAGRVQPVGVPGELHAGGVQVARGYLGRPAQTAEVYVPHPFVPGARVYRTGDRARWRPDGTLEFLGRTDHQVKIRGFRVEPAEVETALRAHPQVADALVLAVAAPDGGARLVGYVTAAPGQSAPDTPALRTHLRAALPSPMVPDVFVALDAFPLTPYGKIDRAALPRPGRAPAKERRAPADDLQHVLAGVWEQTLEITDVSVDDDFFERGGHSVLATIVVSSIRELFRLELPLHFFVEAPTVATLATLMRAEGAEAGIDVDRVAALVRQVQSMSHNEVQQKLEG